MPNHITNYVRISGAPKQIERLIKDTNYKVDTDSDNEFDFNGIKEMPEELQNIACPPTIVETQAEADEKNKRENESAVGYNYQWAMTKEKSDKLRKKYGHNNWYNWAIGNWGTKWNCYEVQSLAHGKNYITLKFDTAWSQPDAIYQELEHLGFEVNAVYYDEDPSNTGDWGYRPYEFFSLYTTHEVEPNYSHEENN